MATYLCRPSTVLSPVRIDRVVEEMMEKLFVIVVKDTDGTPEGKLVQVINTFTISLFVKIPLNLKIKICLSIISL